MSANLAPVLSFRSQCMTLQGRPECRTALLLWVALWIQSQVYSERFHWALWSVQQHNLFPRLISYLVPGTVPSEAEWSLLGSSRPRAVSIYGESLLDYREPACNHRTAMKSWDDPVFGNSCFYFDCTDLRYYISHYCHIGLHKTVSSICATFMDTISPLACAPERWT